MEACRAYLGDVTALATCSEGGGDPHEAVVAVGSGGLLSLYNAEEGELVGKVQVFESGVRIHGIAVSGTGKSEEQLLVAYGETRAEIYRASGSRELSLARLGSIGPLGDWIMDATFLPPSREPPADSLACLALGLSNNSVRLVDVRANSSVAEIATFSCSMTYLLYSMRLFHSPKDGRLRVAAGTIFNSVLIWDFQLGQVPAREAVVRPTLSLVGHQGSIHSLRWSDSGDMLASCSDDRTARVWALASDSTLIRESIERGEAKESLTSVEALEVIYGHEGRLWDCVFIGQSCDILATASEDCTCKLWSLGAAQETWKGKGGVGKRDHERDCITTLVGHEGKGVWQIAVAGQYLVTAGADGAVKKWFLRHCCDPPDLATTSLPSMEIRSYQHSLPPLAGTKAWEGEVEGKGKKNQGKTKEWVRCLKMADMTTLYVATNQGMVYIKGATTAGKEDWVALHASPRQRPILCIEVYRGGRGSVHSENDFVCAGDTEGYVAVVSVGAAAAKKGRRGKVSSVMEWVAHERRVLGLFPQRPNASQPSTDRSFSLFTTDISGEVKWWSVPYDASPGDAATLRAKMRPPYAMRILCVDVCKASGLVICGDQRGSIMAFKYATMEPGGEVLGPNVSEVLDLALLVKHQHGSEAVSFLRVVAPRLVVSGGRDGKLYEYEIRSSSRGSSLRRYEENAESAPGLTSLEEDVSLRPVGIHIDKHVVAVEEQIEVGRNATCLAGFQSSDFLVWNVSANVEVIRIACGGWRRPRSLVMDSRLGLSFAHVKDGVIRVQTLLPRQPFRSEKSPSIFSNALHPSFHGEVVHTAKLWRPSMTSSTVFAITGSEDGYVRHSRWDFGEAAGSGVALGATGVLGKCVGGAQVREVSICQAIANGGGESDGGGDSSAPEGGKDSDGRVYVVAVGAKEVAMVWSVFLGQREPSASPIGGDLGCRLVCAKEPKGGLRPKSNKAKSAMAAAASADVRYLAVDTMATAGGETSPLDLVFVLISSADASITLAAVQVDTETGQSRWHPSVCELASGAESPTLSIRLGRIAGGCVLAFTGATNGTICAWDLSAVVGSFTRSLVQGPEMSEFSGQKIRPLAQYEGVHLSGVNAIAVSVGETGAEAPGGLGVGECVVVSGGDDQAMHVMALSLGTSEEGKVLLSKVRDAHRSNAHHSSIRSVWTDGTHAATTGLDQRLNFWRILGLPAPRQQQQQMEGEGEGGEDGGGVELLHASVVEAGETETLDAAMAVPRGAGGARAWDMVLGGRGLSALRIQVNNK